MTTDSERKARAWDEFMSWLEREQKQCKSTLGIAYYGIAFCRGQIILRDIDEPKAALSFKFIDAGGES